MYQLFNLPWTTNWGVITNPQWNNIRAGLLSNLDTVSEYYRNHTLTVPADMILVSIINALGIGEELSDKEYYQWCQRQALSVSQALQITSSATRGKVHRNQFFGPGIREILLSETESLDYSVILKNWKTVQAIKVLSHPISDLNIPILNRGYTGGERGHAVISINIPTLMLQYRAFRAFEKQREEQGLPIHAFIHRFILPNMAATTLDYSLFQRFYRLYFGLEQTTKAYKHPFYLTDWSGRIDGLYQGLITYLKTHSLSFPEIMKTIPLAKANTVLDLSILPDFYRNRQVNWALSLSRLDLLHLLMDLNYHGFGNRNQQEINSIKRHIDFYRNDKSFSHMLPSDQARIIEEKLNILMLY